MGLEIKQGVTCLEMVTVRAQKFGTFLTGKPRQTSGLAQTDAETKLRFSGMGCDVSNFVIDFLNELMGIFTNGAQCLHCNWDEVVRLF